MKMLDGKFTHCVSHLIKPMAPKKRARTSRTLDELPSVQQKLDGWLQQVYDRRHQTAQGAMALPAMEWPVEHGGTFLEIANRSWQDPSKILSGALRLSKKAGVVNEEASLEDFTRQFCKLEAGAADMR